MKNRNILFLALIILGFACAQQEAPKATLTSAPFGTLPNGDSVTLFTLTNVNGLSMDMMTYGGIVTALRVPDRDGKLEDVVLGYDNLDGYLKSSPYFGALIGRYGNRIADGRFTLDSVEYTLVQNNGKKP